MEKAKLFIGLIISPGLDLGIVDKCIEEQFGQIETASKTFDFSHTSYYQHEMGLNLSKQFYTIKLKQSFINLKKIIFMCVPSFQSSCFV